MLAVLVCGWALCCIAQDDTRGVTALPRAFIQTSSVADLEAVRDPMTLKALNLLDFPGNQDQIDDEDLAALERFTELRTLVVGCPLLTDVGLKNIAKIPQVECLVIYGGKITDAGLQQLRQMPRLRVLGLYETAVTVKGIDDLKAEVDELYVERWSDENGVVFDANGCFNPAILKPPLQVPRDAAR